MRKIMKISALALIAFLLIGYLPTLKNNSSALAEPPWLKGMAVEEQRIFFGGKLHMIYTLFSKNPETYYTEKGEKGWSKPVFVGGEYARMGVCAKGVFIVSSLEHRPTIYYKTTGQWKKVVFNQTWSTVTNISTEHGVIAAWRGDHKVFMTRFNGKNFTEPEEVAEEIYPVREIKIIGGNEIKLNEEGLREWVNVTYVKKYRWVEISEEREEKKIERFGNYPTKTRGALPDWTYLVYMDEDNSLNGYGYNGDMKEMISGYNFSSRGRVNVLVYDDRKGNGDTRIYYVDNFGAHDISEQAASWLKSEMNSGDYHTLVDFVEWAVKNYPAKHYFLDLWDHGLYYYGAMWDETSGTHMSVLDLGKAASRIHEDLGIKIDIWGYDACLMDAGADIYQIKDGAKIFVGSEHTEGGDGWDYKALIGNLTSNPEQSPEEYAYSHVVHVDDEYNRQDITTMVAINLTRWSEGFMVAYNQFAQALRARARTNGSEIREAFNTTAISDRGYWSSGRDVGDFAKKVVEYVKDEKIDYWAQRLLENISYSVINYFDTNSGGRKIIMGETSSTSEINSNFQIFKDTEWDEMLRQVYIVKEDDTLPPPTCSIENPGGGQFYTNQTIEVNGTAGDLDGNISYVQVRVDGGDWHLAHGNATWNYSLSLSSLAPGVHRIYARSYNGDMFSLPSVVQINVISTKPDLKVDNISFNNTSPSAGEEVSVNVEIENMGGTKAENFSLSLYYDSPSPETLIGSVENLSLNAGENENVEFRWNTTLLGGERKVIAFVDSSMRINESNEENNALAEYIYIRGNVTSPPLNLSAFVESDSVYLSWSPPENLGGSKIECYKIYRGTESGGEKFLKSVDTTYYEDKSVVNGTSYFYYVTAVNRIGESPPSKEINVTLKGIPNPPGNLSAKPGNGFVFLSWSEPSYDGGYNITEYRIYRGNHSGDEVFIASVSGANLSYNDSEVINNHTYFYYVTAVNSEGESAGSNEVNATPCYPPTAPELTAIFGSGYVFLHWNESDSNVAYYRVYRGLAPGDESLIAELNGSHTTYVDSNVTPGLRYYYYIVAENCGGASERSNEVYGVPKGAPGAPRNLTGVQRGAGIILTWDPPGNDGGSPISSYYIYRGSSAGGEKRISEVKGESYWDYNISYGKTYFYYVTAVNDYGESPESNEIQVRTEFVIGAPINLNLEIEDGHVVLTWEPPVNSKVVNISGYNVYRNGEKIATTEDLSYVDIDAKMNRTYEYYVTAVCSGEEGNASNPVNITLKTPPAVENVSVRIEGDMVKISWSEPKNMSGIPKIMYYRVYEKKDGKWVVLTNTSSTHAEIKMTKGLFGGWREIKIVPVNSLGEGEGKEVKIPIEVDYGSWLIIPVMILAIFVVLALREWAFKKS